MVDTKKTGYGAIDVPEGRDEFDEKNTYYLNESRFNWGRFFRAAVPIVVALAIMGGFAYGMSHGFGHFYGPPRGTDDGNSIKSDESWIPEESSGVEADSGASESHGSSSLCAENEKCAALGLNGACCPSEKGVMLECCL